MRYVTDNDGGVGESDAVMIGDDWASTSTSTSLVDFVFVQSASEMNELYVKVMCRRCHVDISV